MKEQTETTEVGVEARFVGAVRTVAAAVKREFAFSSCLLLHHNDADGIASGAILSAAFSRLGMRVSRYCLEKPFPAVVRRIVEDREERLLVVADFGSGMVSQFLALKHPEGRVLLLDHHQLEAGYRHQDPGCWVLNPLMLGMEAASAASAATVCALFAEALSDDNRDLSWLGVVGWQGDGQRDQGLNAIVSSHAIAAGGLNKDVGDKVWRGDHPLRAIVEGVNALGAFDYLRGGPDIAMKGLLSDNIAGLLQMAERARQRYDEAFRSGQGVRVEQHPSGRLQSFFLGEAFAQFGVKTVGLVCEELIARGLVAADRYLVGFQRVPDDIPGIGPVPLNQVKVSMRLPPGVAREVTEGRALPLTELLPPAARQLGGFVDACHPHAAAVSIDEGQESELLERLAEIVSFGGRR